MRSQSLAISVLTLCVIAFAGPSSEGRAQTLHKVPVFFHIAPSLENASAPAAQASFIAAQLSHANQTYGPLGMELVHAGHAELSDKHAALVSRADRDALARYLRPGVVNCMLVASLMDVDEPGRVRRGVHWRPRTQPSRHFVIVSAISGPYVLGHELGHFFGNREHSETPGNLMSYQLTDAIPVLDLAQIARVRTTLAKMIETRELRLLPH